MGKTVFILGAGASKDFGSSMPVGEELAATIDQLLINEFSDASMSLDGPLKNAFRQSTGLSLAHRKAALQIAKSLHAKPSIDELIDEWSDFPELVNVGKSAIAVCILSAEGRSSLNHELNNEIGWAAQFRPLRDSWASWLFRNLGGEGVRRREAFQAFNDTAFITFNYDRCLEQFLLANFIHSCNLPSDVALAALKNIEIHHAYGSLGELPLTGGHQVVKFGSNDPWAVSIASDRIRTFTEEIESKSAERISKVVHDADRLIFLGFGFHKRNLDLLFGVDGACPAKPCFGTNTIPVHLWARLESRFSSALSQRWSTEHASNFMRSEGEFALDL